MEMGPMLESLRQIRPDCHPVSLQGIGRFGGLSISQSLECAIQALAPTCEHCSCRIIGHGCQRTAQVLLTETFSPRLGDGILADP
jgi:hypothetical protein